MAVTWDRRLRKQRGEQRNERGRRGEKNYETKSKIFFMTVYLAEGLVSGPTNGQGFAIFPPLPRDRQEVASNNHVGN